MQTPDEIIIEKILLIRGQKVMLDRDLASLYGVSTGNLNKAVKRNLKRFPEDFMFQLTNSELQNLIFQSGRSNWGGIRKLPFVFTEQGVAMLSSVLNSDQAIEVNIRIIRIFTRLRELLMTNKEILLQLEILEKKVIKSEVDIEAIFRAMKELLSSKALPRKRIGYKSDHL